MNKIFFFTIIINSFFQLTIAQSNSNNLALGIGKKLYEADCSQCHLLLKKVSYSIPLEHIRQERGKQYVYQFTQNSAKLLALGNKTAQKVYKKYGRAPMPLYPNLTKNEIDAICDYIDGYSTRRNY
ncbi:MAG TPA: c-type cytochrome [Puia sp.]|nr:c-type cytochrome [Puia sp.]